MKFSNIYKTQENRNMFYIKIREWKLSISDSFARLLFYTLTEYILSFNSKNIIESIV